MAERAYQQALIEHIALNPSLNIPEEDRTFLLFHSPELAPLSFEQIEEYTGISGQIRRKLPGILTGIAEFDTPEYIQNAANAIERYQDLKPIVERVKATSRWPNDHRLNDFTEEGIRYEEIAPTHSSLTYEIRYLFWITDNTDKEFVVKVWGNRVPYYKEEDRDQLHSISRGRMLAELPALLRAQVFEEQVKVIGYSFQDQAVVLEPAKGQSLDRFTSYNGISRQQAIELLEIARKYHQQGLGIDMRNTANIFFDGQTGKFQILDPRDATNTQWEAQLYTFLFFLHNCLNPISHHGGRRYHYSFEEIKEFFWDILQETESEKTLENMRKIMQWFDSQQARLIIKGEI